MLTQEDFDLFREGKVSDRLSQSWGFTYQSLKSEIEAGNYEVISAGNNQR